MEWPRIARLPCGRPMLFAASGLWSFRAPAADGVGDPMPEALQKTRQIAGNTARCADGPRVRLSTPWRCLQRVGWPEENRHQSAPKVAVRAKIPCGDAAAGESSCRGRYLRSRCVIDREYPDRLAPG